MAWHVVACMERTHGKNQAGRDLIKSLEWPPAGSRGSCGVRTGCLGLDSIMSVQAPCVFKSLRTAWAAAWLFSQRRKWLYGLWTSPACVLAVCVCVRFWLYSLCCLSGGFAVWFLEGGDKFPDLSVSPWYFGCSAHREVGCLRIQAKMQFLGQELQRVRKCWLCYIWYPVSMELRYEAMPIIGRARSPKSGICKVLYEAKTRTKLLKLCLFV